MSQADRPPIKVMFVIGTLNVGGAETQLVELASRLDRRRFEPVVCSLFSGGALTEPLRARGVRVHVLNFDALPGSRIGLILALPAAGRALRQLWRVVRTESPVILHGVLFWAYILAAFIGRAARVPFVVASRRSLGLFKANRPHYLLLERLANRMTDLIVANSEAVRRDTARREGLPPERILVIRNGLDLSRFTAAPATRTAEGLAWGSPRVIIVSNLIQYKGHEYFFHAWRDVLVEFPSATALLVGDGAWRPALEKRAEELGIRHAVQFLGVRHDVPALLAAADLYVHPSLQEGFSNALLEAMAAGKPIVATDVGGNGEAVVDGVTGRLVPPGDARALHGAIAGLLREADAAARMAASAQRVAVERHEIGMMVHAYEDVYTRLASGRRRPAGRS